MNYKPFDYGFIVLCHSNATVLVNNTIKSLIRNYPTKPCICVVDSEFTKQEIADIKKICLVHKGGKTFTSLINKGMAKTTVPWNILLMAGVWVKPKLDQKFSTFLTSEKDILYPIADGKYNFVDATLNGLTIHKNTFKEVGDIPEDKELDICKLLWALDAIKYGCQFKAIQGAKIC
jgi:hypothetical protein